MTTRTEWLASLQRADRVTLQDVVLTAQAYLPTPDEIAAYLAFLETLAAGLRPIVYPEGESEPELASVPDGPAPVPESAAPESIPAAVPETTPTPEEVI